MATWKKTNGNIIAINDTPEAEAYAESLGWVRVKAPAKKKVAKKVVKKK